MNELNLPFAVFLHDFYDTCGEFAAKFCVIVNSLQFSLIAFIKVLFNIITAVSGLLLLCDKPYSRVIKFETGPLA